MGEGADDGIHKLMKGLVHFTIHWEQGSIVSAAMRHWCVANTGQSISLSIHCIGKKYFGFHSSGPDTTINYFCLLEFSRSLTFRHLRHCFGSHNQKNEWFIKYFFVIVVDGFCGQNRCMLEYLLHGQALLPCCQYIVFLLSVYSTRTAVMRQC